MLRHRVQVESRQPSLQALSWPAPNPAGPFREKRPRVGKHRRWKGRARETRSPDFAQAVLEQRDWADGGRSLGTLSGDWLPGGLRLCLLPLAAPMLAQRPSLCWVWPGSGCVWVLSCFSHVRPFATPWTIPCQAPLSAKFSGQEYWSGLPCSPPGDLPDPGIEPASPALQSDALPSEPPGKSWSGEQGLILQEVQENSTIWAWGWVTRAQEVAHTYRPRGTQRGHSPAYPGLWDASCGVDSSSARTPISSPSQRWIVFISLQLNCETKLGPISDQRHFSQACSGKTKSIKLLPAPLWEALSSPWQQDGSSGGGRLILCGSVAGLL